MMSSLVVEFAEKKPTLFTRVEKDPASRPLRQYRELIKFKPDLLSLNMPNQDMQAGDRKVSNSSNVHYLKEIAMNSSFAAPKSDLERTINSRQSTRNYGDQALSLNTLSALLENSCGIRNEKGQRKYPSGGALYPIDIYVSLNTFAIDNEQLVAGNYRYDATTSKLQLINEQSMFSVKALNQVFVPKAAGLICLVFDLDKVKPKYGEFGYKLALLEAGHIAQNLLLVMESLSLTGIPLQFYYEDILNDVLALTSEEASVCYAIEFGTKPIIEKE